MARRPLDLEWTLAAIVIPPSGQISFQFDVTGNLLPGTTFASSSIRVEEDDEASFIDTTSTTGDTAPITATRHYIISAIHNGETVTVTASVTNIGVEVLSWVES